MGARCTTSAVEALDGHVSAPENRHLTVGEHDDLPGLAEECRNVRGQIRFVVADAEHERRAAAAQRDDHVRLVCGDAGHRKRSLQHLGGTAHGLWQPEAQVPLHQVREHLGVGLRPEAVPLGHERSPQRVVVLDDAVVHDGQPSGAVRVRMGVRLVGPSVRGPARVRDAEAARRVASGDGGFQIRDLAGAPARFETAAVDRRQSRRVVAAVLEPLQRRKQKFDRVVTTDVADNAAHAGGRSGSERQEAAQPPAARVAGPAVSAVTVVAVVTGERAIVEVEDDADHLGGIEQIQPFGEQPARRLVGRDDDAESRRPIVRSAGNPAPARAAACRRARSRSGRAPPSAALRAAARSAARRCPSLPSPAGSTERFKRSKRRTTWRERDRGSTMASTARAERRAKREVARRPSGAGDRHRSAGPCALVRLRERAGQIQRRDRLAVARASDS